VEKKNEKNGVMKYLIDTNIIIDHLRIGEEKATNFLKKVERGEVKASISVITEYELLVSQKFLHLKDYSFKNYFLFCLLFLLLLPSFEKQ